MNALPKRKTPHCGLVERFTNVLSGGQVREERGTGGGEVDSLTYEQRKGNFRCPIMTV